MKRVDLIRHLVSHGCYLLRDRGRHSVYANQANNRTSAYRVTAKSTTILQDEFVAIWKSPRRNHTIPHRFRKYHSSPIKPTNTKKNGHVSQ